MDSLTSLYQLTCVVIQDEVEQVISERLEDLSLIVESMEVDLPQTFP